VAKNARAVIAAALIAVLSILLVQSGFQLVGAGVFVLGMLGLAAIRERDEDTDTTSTGDAQAKLDRAIVADAAGTPSAPTSGPAPMPTRPAPAGGLPTWQPTGRPTPAPEDDFGPGAGSPTAFSPFPQAGPMPEADFGPSAGSPTAFSPFSQPGADAETRPASPPAEPPAIQPAGGSSWDAWQEVDRGPVADEFDTANPLADLDRLDEIDPVAEVERLERLGAPGPSTPAASTAFSFSSASRINEAAVQTDDDIMAASQATELAVSDGQETELARLLAKVQQRLAAYE
jgi:hypothetical protein